MQLHPGSSCGQGELPFGPYFHHHDLVPTWSSGQSIGGLMMHQGLASDQWLLSLWPPYLGAFIGRGFTSDLVGHKLMSVQALQLP